MNKPDALSPYNPVDVPNIALSLALEVLEQDLHPVPPAKTSPGAGIYLIYYFGEFKPYHALAVVNSENDCRLPIYVGKGERKGKRKGISFEQSKEAAIHSRLSNHAKSIQSAENLSLSDFRCRYLAIEEAFIGLAESVLISVFRPLWNQVVEGFGNNPTGGPRSSQARSGWDVVHPGRVRGLGKPKKSVAELTGLITTHLQSLDSAGTDEELARIRDRIQKYELG